VSSTPSTRRPGTCSSASASQHYRQPLVDDNSAGHRDSLHDLATLLRAFAQARDWEQYHTPKNLAMALAGEAGELVACFQWLTPDESAHVMEDPVTAEAVESELADVLQYLIRLADVLGIDLVPRPGTLFV